MTQQPLAFLALLAAFALPCHAQQKSPLAPARSARSAVPRAIAALAVDTVDVRAYPRVRLVFSALDRDGHAVLGLSAADVQVKADSSTVTLDSLRPVLPLGRDIEVVVVLDISGSVRPALPDIRAGLLAVVERLGTSLPVGLVSAGTSATWERYPRAGDRAGLDSLIGTIRAAAPRTALWDAIALAATPDSVHPGTQRRLVVISDGDDNASRRSLAAVREQLRSAGTDVHVLLVGPRVNRAGLTQLATAARGSVQRADLAGVRQALVAIGSGLASSYEGSLTVEARPGIWESLTVTVKEPTPIVAVSRPVVLHVPASARVTGVSAAPAIWSLLGWAFVGAVLAVVLLTALAGRRVWRSAAPPLAASLGAVLAAVAWLVRGTWT